MAAAVTLQLSFETFTFQVDAFFCKATQLHLTYPWPPDAVNFRASRNETCLSLLMSLSTTVYFNEIVFPSVLGLTSPMAFPQHSPPT